MGRSRIDNGVRLPLARFSVYTWIFLAAVAVAVALFVIWAFWFAEPMYPQLR